MLKFSSTSRFAQQHLKTVRYAVVALSVLISSAFFVLQSDTVWATAEPTISGGADIAGLVDEYIAIDGVSVSADPGANVKIYLYVSKGSLSMTETNNIVFDGSTIGERIRFSGAVEDVNTALASLRYRTTTPGPVQFSASIATDGQWYNPANGHVYEVINNGAGITANEARVAAHSRTLQDLNGYLVTITSQQENDFIKNQVQTDGWLGASDAAEEGRWVWDEGPEDGTNFWQGRGSTGNSVNGLYNNWNQDEPNNSDGIENCGQFYSWGKWNDLTCDSSQLWNYVVEYGDSGNLPDISHATHTITVSYPESNATVVSNCSELTDLANDPSAHRYDTITLADNIDCNNAHISPLFSAYDNTLGRLDFRGTFDGNNYSISNLVVDDNDGDAKGVIGYSKDATIKNLNLSNITVQTDNVCVGSLVGSAYNTAIQNVSAEAINISGAYSVGGLVGCMRGGLDGALAGHSEITNSSAGLLDPAQISGSSVWSDSLGGLLGYGDFEGGSTLSLKDNSANSYIVGGGDIGGIVGYLEFYNQGTAGELSGNTGAVEFECSYVCGGLTGGLYSEDHTNILVKDNALEGLITGGNWGYETGGILGYIDIEYKVSATIDNNVSTVNFVNGNEQLGGIIGYSYATGGSNLSVTSNNYSGSLQGTYEVAGIVGYLDVYESNVAVSMNLADVTLDGNGELGGIVGYYYSEGYESDGTITLATFDKNGVTGMISGTDEGAGGIIGYANPYYNSVLAISRSYNKASVEGSSEVGGIIGYLYSYVYDGDTAVNITDSYSNASISGNYNVGGILGYLSSYYEEPSTVSVNIDNTYTHGSIDASSNVGGLLGYVDYLVQDYSSVTMSDSFSDAVVTAMDYPEADAGAILGYTSSDIGSAAEGSNLHYQQAESGASSVCTTVQDVLADCTGHTEADYFAANNTVEPVAQWNFTSTWGTSQSLNDERPCLQWESQSCQARADGDNDGADNDTESAGPNGGDANDDQVADANQRNVTSLPHKGNYVVVQTSCNNNFNLQIGDESSEDRDVAYDYPVGLVAFVGRSCGPAGSSVQVTLYFYGDYQASQLTLRKSNAGTYSTIQGAVLSDVTIGGKKAVRATYTVVDGGALDADGQADGNIVDPVGLAALTIGVPNTGLGAVHSF